MAPSVTNFFLEAIWNRCFRAIFCQTIRASVAMRSASPALRESGGPNGSLAIKAECLSMLSETSSVQHASGQTAVRTERAIIPGMQTLWHADALACRRFGMRTPWDADARAVLNYATLPFKIRSPARFLRKGEPTTNGVFIEAMTCNYRHEEPLELLFRPIP